MRKVNNRIGLMMEIIGGSFYWISAISSHNSRSITITANPCTVKIDRWCCTMMLVGSFSEIVYEQCLLNSFAQYWKLEMGALFQTLQLSLPRTHQILSALLDRLFLTISVERWSDKEISMLELCIYSIHICKD